MLLKRLRLASALQAGVISILAPGLLLTPVTGWANPTGGVVTHGSAQIDMTNLAHLKVLQESNRAVINWESFSIGAGEITEFIQPSASAIALSKVVGGNPSAIYGTLKANGGHILVNQNGILVGPGGMVDIGGMNVLSTLDIDSNAFMAGGDMRFIGSTAAGVTNFGTISSAGGDVILMGNFVENNGSIGAVNGTVALGAGGEILLHSSGDAKISILRGGVGGNTGVNNTGTITGAAAELKAHGNVYALAVNNSGTIRATGASRVNGRVVLSATGADGSGSSKIVNTGTIQANNRDGSGGTIMIDAGLAGEAEIGGTVKADGVGNRPGGTITVLGDIVNVTEGALVSANGSRGGSITIGSPTSSSVNVATGATVQAAGSSGVAGTILVAGQQVGLEGTLDATSAAADGGRIDVRGADISTAATSVINSSGFNNGGMINVRGTEELSVKGAVISDGINGAGGRVILTAPNTIIRDGADVGADGRTRGGAVNVGGGFQGKDASIPNAQNTTVEDGATISADATAGHGGTAIVWADKDTTFYGDIRARALGSVGNGGLIEVSGKETLTVNGTVEASSVGGRAGMVLFDPGNVLVANTEANGVAGSANNLPAAPGIISNKTINDTLQSGTSVIIATESGNITFANTGIENERHDFIQWTNSNADFGVFASGSIVIQNTIRTSGGGSINLLAGWTGSEADLLPGGLFSPGYVNPLTGQFNANAGALNPEQVWEHYVENGQFGNGIGSILIGDGALNRHFEVGSRYGNTNVAGNTLIMTTTQIAADTGETDFVHLGFRDSGAVLSRAGGSATDVFTGVHTNTAFDLNDRTAMADNDPAVAYFDYDEYTAYMEARALAIQNGTPLPTMPAYMRDMNGDTVPDGVYAVNSSGILDASNTSTGGNPTFMSFSNQYTSNVFGNWWYQQIDAASADPLGLGGRLPENGAGQSITNRADINVALTGGLLMKSGGRHQNYAQIGHGGNSSQWGVDRSLRDTGAGGILDSQAFRFFTTNGANADRTSTSIARLAPIYGNINILTGVDRNTVNYDPLNQKVNLTGTTNSTAGLIRMEAWQNTASTNNLANPETGNNSESPVQIGHLGVGQFGNVVGDINVKAGGDIELLAGAHTRNYAAIGHQMGGYVYWNPHSDRSMQIRFFANATDFDNPNLRRGELFVHANGVDDARGAYTADFRADRWDGDFWDVDSVTAGNQAGVAVTGRDGFHPAGPMHIPGFSGAVDKTLVGDINVESYGNTGIKIVAFSTPDTTTGTYNTSNDVDGLAYDGLRFVRDSRYAMIGHGGRGFSIGAENGDDRVRLRIQNGSADGNDGNDGDNELSASLDTKLLLTGTEGGSEINRSPTFTNMIGDISVKAVNGGVEVTAGNDAYDFAAIGHGGAELTDMETGNVAIGDITVTGAKSLVMRGASAKNVPGYADLPDFTGDLSGARVQRAQAQIGHHGYEARTNYYTGDITVDFDGDVMLVGGRYRDSGAKIGHQTAQGYGQSGGDFFRDEQFLFGPHFIVTPTSADFAPINADATVVGNTATITVGSQVNTYDISGNTANISVSAGGDLIMRHSPVGLAINQNQAKRNFDLAQNNLNDLRFVEVLIGHGARRTGLLRNNSLNAQYNSKDKMGDITVNAGNINMTSGSGLNWFTSIGHMFGTGDSFDAANLSLDRAGVLFGNISITALNDIVLDASVADPSDTTNLSLAGFGAPVRSNYVRIGHGGVYDNNDVVVLSDGSVRKGLVALSDISVEVGNDMVVRGGRGELGSYAQVGHGYTDDVGNSRHRPSGFAGNIDVVVGNDLTLEAGSQAWIDTPGGVDVVQVVAAAAVIGHGGDQIEDDMKGDITVSVGNDLNITAAQRTQGAARDSVGNPAASLYGLAKIGHWSTSYQNIATFQQVVSNQSGNILVEVGNDLNMTGGNSADQNVAIVGNPQNILPGLLRSPTILGFTQIGHSGPGVVGLKAGDIDVRVGNDLTTTRGWKDPDPAPGVLGTPNLNNYVMIGNGDWLPDGLQVVQPATGGTGSRSGDISVAVGENAFFDRTLVGHYDPRLLPSILTAISGTTTIGVSRNIPFFGGTGTLDAVDSVFTSALNGSEELRFYLPARTNNLMTLADNNRFNSATTVYRGVGGTAGANFTDGSHATLGRTWDPTRNGGVDAGDLDEIYLQPDLWWNRTAVTTSVGTAADFSAGSVATVSAPGGLPNLVALAAGDLGDGTAEYRGTGANLYTMYYDAIAPVGLFPPTPSGGGGGTGVPVPVIPEPPVVPLPFDFLPYIWSDKYDSFDRDDQWLLGGSDYFIEGIGLISRLLGDVDGEPGVGAQYDSEAVESLAEIFGFPVDETDEEEEADLREQNAAAYRQLGRLYGIYWQFQAFGGSGHYSSNNLFGTPGL